MALAVAGAIFTSAQSAAAAPAARTIVLVRHGAYDTAAPRSEDGPGLVPLGIAQARLTGARLRGLPDAPRKIIASNMTRARQTAGVIHETLPEVPVELTDTLRECTPRTVNAMGAMALEAAQLCEKRLDAAFATYFIAAADGAETDVLVCHGNVIRYFVMKTLGVDATHWLQMSVGHGSLTVIRIEPNGAYHLLSVGDVGHLPPNMQSGVTERDPQLLAP
jgi:serine/threonine-protein phosphatase PGAM5